MRIVMLHFDQRQMPTQGEFFGNERRLIARMKIACDCARFDLEQFDQPIERRAQCICRANIRKITDVRREIKQFVFREAKRVFEFAAEREHFSMQFATSSEHHAVRVDNRVVRAD